MSKNGGRCACRHKMTLGLNALITNLCESAQNVLKRCFHFPFTVNQRIMRAKSTVNGFSAWNTKQRTTSPLLRWAGTQAHFLLHAHLMSPILSACHILFRNTGLTPRRCAPERDFHILPNLKTKTVMKRRKLFVLSARKPNPKRC